MTTVEVFAPAKVNLTLHVTGQRPDGYHLIDSLVAFAPVCDRLRIRPGEALTLSVDGPEAADVPPGDDNLVMRAAAALSGGRGASLHLRKNLPVASGIGGGSADAAAAIRGLLLYWMDAAEAQALENAPDEAISDRYAHLLGLGADVPMCLLARSCRARGIGEKIEFIDLPAVPALLVNPRLPVSTPQVFKNLRSRDNPPMDPVLPRFFSGDELIEWLAGQRNDLEGPAIRVQPAIAEVLSVLHATPGCRLARMSGSGATCFALYDTVEVATEAAQLVAARQPAWWTAAGLLGNYADAATPTVS